jgi:sugar phosphate isomerase/epimerase
MKIGVFSVILGQLPFDQALDQLVSLGVECVEFGTGAFPGKAHCDPDTLLADRGRFDEWTGSIRSRGLEISSLSCHGNPLHPDYAIGHAHHETFRSTVRLAAELGVNVVTTFAGCPGDHAEARHPNWVTYHWPPDFQKILAWQWGEVAIPYWKEQAQFAADHGVKIAIEPHPGFLVYNPETLLRLRDATGETVGVNFDPSHFFWQGIDPIKAVHRLGGTIHHVHAKDTALHPIHAAVNGHLDTKLSAAVSERSWIFRTVGYGHGEDFWCGFVSALRMCGYDGAISIEHEDALMTPMEGLRKGVEFLQRVVIREGKAVAATA